MDAASGVTVICSRHRKRCVLAAVTWPVKGPERVTHADGGYCDSQLFTVRNERQVDPESARSVLARDREERREMA